MRFLLRTIGGLLIFIGGAWVVLLCGLAAFYWLMYKVNAEGELDIRDGSIARSLWYAAVGIIPWVIGGFLRSAVKDEPRR